MSNRRTKREILRLMPRVGLGDRVAQADAVLPDVLDLSTDEHRKLLAQVGLPADVDYLRDRLGGSP